MVYCFQLLPLNRDYTVGGKFKQIWKRDLTLRKPEQNLPERTAMRMFRWMVGIKRIEKIRNEEIRGGAGMANITEKIRKTTLRLLVHVERKTEEDLVMKPWNMEVGGHRKIERPKLR